MFGLDMSTLLTLGICLVLCMMVMYYCRSKLNSFHGKIEAMLGLVNTLSTRVEMLSAGQVLSPAGNISQGGNLSQSDNISQGANISQEANISNANISNANLQADNVDEIQDGFDTNNELEEIPSDEKHIVMNIMDLAHPYGDLTGMLGGNKEGMVYEVNSDSESEDDESDDESEEETDDDEEESVHIGEQVDDVVDDLVEVEVDDVVDDLVEVEVDDEVEATPTHEPVGVDITTLTENESETKSIVLNANGNSDANANANDEPTLTEWIQTTALSVEIPDFRKMSVAELREYASTHNKAENPAKLKKKELIDLLSASASA